MHAAHIIAVAVAEIISTVTKEIPPSSTHRQPLVGSHCPPINKKPHLHTVGWWVHSGQTPATQKDSTFITAKWVSIWIPRLLRQIELVCYLRYNPSIFSEILKQDLKIVLDRECAKYQFVCQCHTVLSRIKLTIIFNTNYQNKSGRQFIATKSQEIVQYSYLCFVLPTLISLIPASVQMAAFAIQSRKVTQCQITVWDCGSRFCTDFVWFMSLNFPAEAFV